MFSPLYFFPKNIPKLPYQYDLISPNHGSVQILKNNFFIFLCREFNSDNFKTNPVE